MKRGLKWIEHKGYTAPGGKKRDFKQRVRIRRLFAAASRYVQFLSGAFKTYGAMDRMVSELVTAGIEGPSAMAKKKFFVHRPKPADNKAKNRARRHSHVLIVGAATQGARPAPAVRISASSVRAQFRLSPEAITRRIYRSICRDQATGRRNWNWVSQSGIGSRECMRPRKQMGTGEFA